MKHAAAALVAMLASPCVARAQAPSWIIPEILAAAKAEGTLTVYSSTNEQEGLPLWKLYEDATGIKVNYVRNAEGPMLSKIALEARTGQQSWDVQNAGSVNQIPPALVLEWAPPLASEIMPEARDPNKRWHGVYAGYNAPQYNTNLVKPDDLPKSYEDFSRHREWAGKVVIEGTDREWMESIFIHYGRDRGRKLLEDIVATLNPIVLDGHFAMARQPRPGLDAAGHRTHDAVDAQKRHAAQDERRDGRRQVHALREAAGGDGARVFRLRQQVGERVRTNAVDARRPALLAERAARP